MGVAEGSGDVDTDLGDATGRKRSVLEDVGERRVIDELSDDVGDAVVVAGVERPHDVGMVQGCGPVGGVLEQVTDSRFVVELLLQHLQGDAALKGEVGGLVVVGEHAPFDEALDPVSASEHLLHAPQRRKVRARVGGG